jgi:hypothetical protein
MFIARLAVVVDEADESVHWLTVAQDSGVTSGAELEWLLDESGQLSRDPHIPRFMTSDHQHASIMMCERHLRSMTMSRLDWSDI